MSKKSNSSFLKNVIQITAWIMVLSAFGVSLGDIVSFGWFTSASDLLVNFFTF